MKIGDIVTIQDGSWSMMYRNGKLEHVSGGLGRSSRTFKILAMNGSYPTDEPGGVSPDEPNDTMLYEVDYPEQILFTQSRFCNIVSRPEPKEREKMKIGDIVTVNDGSWSMMCVDGILAYARSLGRQSHRRFKILAMDGLYPTETWGCFPIKPNNTMLCDADHPEQILFIQSEFCDVVSKPEPEAEPGNLCCFYQMLLSQLQNRECKHRQAYCTRPMKT